MSELEVENVIWYTMTRGNWTNRGLFIRVDIEKSWYPIGSTCGIFTINKNQPNVGKYIIYRYYTMGIALLPKDVW